MAKYRRDRVNDAVAEETARILREVKDPRVSGSLVSVTRAEVTGDLKSASVYVSVYGEEDMKELKRGLRSVAPFVRSELAKRLNLRVTPEITFVVDNSIRHGAEIAAILKRVLPETDDAEKTDNDTGKTDNDAEISGEAAENIGVYTEKFGEDTEKFGIDGE